MRRRLLALSTVLTALVLVALLVPLVVAYAEERAVTLHESRLAAATRFAALADSIAADGDLAALDPDLLRYDEVSTSTSTWLVGTDGTVLAAGLVDGPDGAARAPGVDAALRRALGGSPTSAPGALWPWSDDPVVAATPIGRDAQVLGAVVLVDDASAARHAVAVRMGWAVVGGIVLLALVAWLVGVPLVGWVVRPVDELRARVLELAQGRASAARRLEGPPELRSLVRSFDEMAASVEHSRRQQRDLVADVSHQLANPLTALRLRLEHLVEDDPRVEPVLAETERMARSLDAVIEVSRAGGFDRSAVEVDVAAQLRERLELWQPLLGPLLEVDLGPDTAPALLEEDLVPTAVDILLDNTLKYAPGARVEVVLRTDAGTGAHVLRVRDHGPGVSDEEARSLGTRFHRLPRHAGVEGTGLGLAILRLRVADADGLVALAGASPGTTVTITLPGRRAPGTTAATPGGVGPVG